MCIQYQDMRELTESQQRTILPSDGFYLRVSVLVHLVESSNLTGSTGTLLCIESMLNFIFYIYTIVSFLLKFCVVKRLDF